MASNMQWALSRIMDQDVTFLAMNFPLKERLTDEYCVQLTESLAVNTSIKRLNCMDCSWREELTAIANALKLNSTVTSLKIAPAESDALINFEVEGIYSIAEMLKVNSSLTSLTIVYTDLEYEGVSVIAEALKVNSSLISLDLSWNELADEESSTIAEALELNSTLVTLNLAHNRIGPEGAFALAKALKVNSSLRSLTLSVNNVATEGALAIAEALMTNTSLTSLDLSGNVLTWEGATAIAEALKVNSSLTLLDLSSIGVLTRIPTLCPPSYKLYCTKLADQLVSAFAEALKVNISLTSLDLYNNCIGKEGASTLADAVRFNPILSSLVLGLEDRVQHSGSDIAVDNQSNLEYIFQMLVGKDCANMLAKENRMKFPVYIMY
jgi:Ran GTPase-activating protein (RanGAP) involved in mRNA processing and transport